MDDLAALHAIIVDLRAETGTIHRMGPDGHLHLSLGAQTLAQRDDFVGDGGKLGGGRFPVGVLQVDLAQLHLFDLLALAFEREGHEP